MAIFYTSDTHFGHKKICEYCPESRGHFKDLDHMNEGLVSLWNETVQPDDTVIHVGDFAMGGKDNVPKFAPRLNGRKVLVRGNHDFDPDFMKQSGFDEVHEQLVMEDVVPGQYAPIRHKLFLHHQPVMDPSLWPDKTDFHLVGHVHQAWARRANIINVGVDVSNLKPHTLEQLIARDLYDCDWCKGKGMLVSKGGMKRKCGECFGWGKKIDEKNGKSHR